MSAGNKMALVGIWLLALIGGYALDGWHEENFLPPPEERRRADVMIDVFGDVKTIMARYLWFKMDLFHEVLDEEGVAPERQAEVLPLLRMVTLLDPSMVDSYDQIAWDLFKGHGKTEEAVEMLEEGLKRNPRSWELWFRKAVIEHKTSDFKNAMPSAQNALKYAQAINPDSQEDAGATAILNSARIVLLVF